MQSHETRARHPDEHNQWTNDTSKQCRSQEVIKVVRLTVLLCRIRNIYSKLHLKSLFPELAFGNFRWEWTSNEQGLCNQWMAVENKECTDVSAEWGYRWHDPRHQDWTKRGLRSGLAHQIVEFSSWTLSGQQVSLLLEHGAEVRYVDAKIAIAYDIHAWISPKLPLQRLSGGHTRAMKTRATTRQSWWRGTWFRLEKRAWSVAPVSHSGVCNMSSMRVFSYSTSANIYDTCKDRGNPVQ